MEKHEIDHLKKVREMAPECMVLLKSDGSFPLDAPGKLALFGEGAGLTIKGAKYEADGITLTNSFPLGHGNSFASPEVTISITGGILLIVESPL